jgi:hypothetical protein
MKNKIKSRSDFKSKIENNPIKLLQAIKEHSLNYNEKKYNMFVILDLMKTLLTRKQKEGESLQDYTEKFWVTREVFKSHLSEPIILTKILSTIKGYNKKPSDDLQIQKTLHLRSRHSSNYLHLTASRMPIKPNADPSYPV